MALRLNITHVIIVVLVVAIVIVGYMAVVGVEAEKEDVGPQEDPMDDGRDPIAWGNFAVSVGIDNQIGKYYAAIENWEANIYSYDGSQRLAVYETDRWNLLGIWSDDIDVRMVCTITGPGKYYAVWEEEYTVAVSEWGYAWTNLQSGNTDFWDQGSYKADIKVYCDGPEFDGLAGSTVEYFTV